jgi:osmotically-inducible protein OsmY
MRRFFDGLAILAIAVLGPAGLHADDRQIAQEIVKNLQAQEQAGNLEDFNIDLHVKDGQVRLKGQVASADDQQRAVDIAQKVAGVESVVDELNVVTAASEPSEAPAPSMLTRLENHLLGSLSRAKPMPAQEIQAVSHEAADPENSREIAEQIIEQLRTHMQNGDLKGFGVEVSVDKGIVTLNGRVSSAQQKQLAIEAASSTDGVKRVVDQLAVVTGASHAPGLLPPTPPAVEQTDSNAQIAQDVVARLRDQKETGELKDFTIDVNVVDGVVWLSGQVANQEQMQLALDQARYVNGVKTVVNDLKVKGTGQFAMAALQQAAPAPLADPSGRAPALLSQPGAPNGTAVGPQMPLAFAQARPVNYQMPGACANCPGGVGGPMPMSGAGLGIAGGAYDHPTMPGYAWPSYAPYPNYGAVTYPRQYSAQAWPYIGPFYPYPQVPLGWRKVTLEWDDGWWMLDFKSH